MGDRDVAGVAPDIGCRQAQTLLEEKLFEDAALSDDEEAQLATHMKTCRACAGFSAITRALEDDAPTPAESLTRTQVGEAVAAYSRRRLLVRAAAGVVAMIMVASGLLAWNLVTEGAFDARRPELADLTTLRGGLEQEAFDRGQLHSIEDTLVDLGNGVLLALGEGSRVEPVELDGENIELALVEGLVAVQVPRRSTRLKTLTVSSELCSVVVKGTVFAVEVESRETRVFVVKGEVEVRQGSETQSSGTELVEGQVLSITEMEQEPLERKKAGEILAMLGLGGVGSVAEVSGSMEEKSEQTAVDAGSPPEHTRNAPRRGDRSVGGSDRPVDAPRKEVEGEPAVAAARAIEALLERARACRRDRDWPCAVDAYDEIEMRFPDRPEAMTATVLRADIELNQLGEPHRALEHYRKYLRLAPDGPLAEEALWGSCRALGAVGDTEGRHRSIEEFLERYPRSAMAAEAEAELTEISGRPR